MLDIIVRQGIVLQQYFLIRRQVKERSPLAGVQNLASWQGVVLNESWCRRPKDGPLSDMRSGQQPRCYRLFFCVVELLFKQTFKRAILTRQQLIYRTFLDHFATVNDADLVCLHHG